MLTHGTIAYKEAGDELSRRISVAMVMTHHRGFLLVWLIAAPHDAELRELLSAKMGFDPDPATMEAKANAAGDPAKVPTPSRSLSPKPDSESPAASAPASAAENPSTKGQATENSAPPSAPVNDATQFRPTLLKPGETMPAEQVQAKPLPKGPSQ